MDISCTKCPNCAGQLETDLKRRMKVCTFCDSEFYITEGNAEQFSAEINYEEIQENETYCVRLCGTPNKVKAITSFREITGWGLKESKEIIDRMPVILFKGLEKEVAEEYVEMFKNRDQKCNIIVEVE